MTGTGTVIAVTMAAVALFIWNLMASPAVRAVTWIIPTLVILLILVHSIRPVAAVAWTVFGVSTAMSLLVLGALALRWRVEAGIQPAPFFRTIAMYAAFAFVGLARLERREGRPPSAQERSGK